MVFMSNKNKLFVFFLILLILPNTFALIPEGHMKIYAVNSDNTALQANLEIIIEPARIPGKGMILPSISSLVGTNTQESVKHSVAVASSLAKEDPSKYDFIINIESSAYSIDGPSAGAAMALLIATMFEDINFPQDVSVTGTVSLDGKVGDVGGIYYKAKKAAETGIKLFMIPVGNREQVISEEGTVKKIDLINYAYETWGMKIVEVSTLEEMFDYVSKDLNSIDINVSKPENKVEYIPPKIEYSVAITPMRNLVDKYIPDAEQKVKAMQNDLNRISEDLKNSGILPGVLTILDYAEDELDLAKQSSNNNYLYSAANYCFLVNVNITAIQEILENPSILDSQSVIFSKKLNDLEKMINDTELRTKQCSLDQMEWCIGAKERLSWAINNLNRLKDPLSISQLEPLDKVINYSYAVGWVDIANDFLDVAITDSKHKFVESTYFKDVSQRYLVDIENKMVLLTQEDVSEEDFQRRYLAAKLDMSKGWYVTATYEAATAYAILVSKQEESAIDFDENSFFNNYNDLQNKLRSISEMNNDEHVWSKMFFDHAMYFYSSAEYYANIGNNIDGQTELKVSNTLTNMAKYIYDVETEVLSYYKSADIDTIVSDAGITDNSLINCDNINVSGEEDNDSNQQTQYVSVYAKEDRSVLFYIVLIILVLVVVGFIIQLSKIHGNSKNKKEFIHKKIAELDEAYMEGKISSFTYNEMKQTYLDELREIKAQENPKITLKAEPVKIKKQEISTKKVTKLKK